MPHRIFDYFNAFIGTSDFDQIYQQYDIRYSIMGHVHLEMLLKNGDNIYLLVSWLSKE